MADFFDRLDIFGLGRAAGDALGIEDRDEEGQAMLDRVMAELGPAVAQGFAERAPGALSRAAAAPIPGVSPEQTSELAGGAWDFISQSPLLNSTVTGMQTYLDLLEQGTPEGEAIRRGIGVGNRDLPEGGGGRGETPESALGHLGENALDYLIPGGKRPANQSFGDIEQLEMGPLEAGVADTLLSSLELAPLATSGGRGIARAVHEAMSGFPTDMAGKPIPLRDTIQEALMDIMDADAARIQRAPATQRRMGQNAPVRYGSFEEIPEDSLEMFIGSLDPQSRDFLMNDPNAREYLTDFIANIEQSADNIVRDIGSGAPPESLKFHAQGLSDALQNDLLVDPEIAEGLTNEVARRAYAAGSQLRRSPTQRIGGQIASRGGPARPLVLGYGRGSPRGLTSQGAPDIGDLVTRAGEPEIGEVLLRGAPDAQERLDARNLLELARERVRLANEADRRGVPVDGLIIERGISQDQLDAAVPPASPGSQNVAPSSRGGPANRLANPPGNPEDAAPAVKMWRVDNPATRDPGSRRAQQWLDENPNSITANFEGRVSTDELLDLPGARGEHNRIEEDNVQRLVESLRERGFDPDSEVLVRVAPSGRAEIWEGNHRLRAARELGIDEVPVRIFYEGGGESASNTWMPSVLRRHISGEDALE